MVELSVEVRSAVKVLHDNKLSTRQIAKKLKVSQHAVRNAIARYRDNGSHHSRPRPGRPRSTTLQEDINIVVSSKRNRTLTASQLKSALNASRKAPRLNFNSQKAPAGGWSARPRGGEETFAAGPKCGEAISLGSRASKLDCP